MFLLVSACQPNNKTEKTIKLPFSPINLSVDQFESLPKDFSAHWISPQLILLPKQQDNYSYQFTYIDTQLNNNEALPYKAQQHKKLTLIETPTWISNRYPHLDGYQAFSLEITQDEAKEWLKNALVVTTIDEQKHPIHLAFAQTGEVIDVIYTSGIQDADEERNLGSSITESNVHFKLWAPTARKVTVKLFNEDKSPSNPKSISLEQELRTGMWTGLGSHSLVGKYYQYEITVFHPASNKTEVITTTDPYSLSLSANSLYSQIVDLNASNTKPNGWKEQQNVALNKPEDAILYELHIRDFSAAEKRLSNELYRGKYKAFSEVESYGIQHLEKLHQAGLNHIHLLPAFDIGTVNEKKSEAITLNFSLKQICELVSSASFCIEELDDTLTLQQLLESYDPATSQAQQVVSELREFDNYNWGYDPFHYTVPEGSYAVNPDGEARIIEFREMVMTLHNMGFRVVMDVVYNHTHQARLEKTAVLDKIVPNYYQRLNPITGDIEQSTCCDNTATERKMMEKLMIDSLVVWSRDYKIDGFRFDLMGHQPLKAMLKAREVVREFDEDTYFYGEGWNFGEVANNAQFVQASQLELPGTEIGTFTDRLRDAVRGPGISVSGNDIRRNQGIGNGLGTMPNELQVEKGAPDYSLLMDQLRIGLAGNLANFPLENSQGEMVTGKDIPYGDQPTGYALDPADTINYVSKHDNQTLWDNNQYRNAFSLSSEQRVRLHIQSLSYAIFAQGIPFLHMGSELLRSKSYLRDSYDYSDWFNRVDFSGEQNYYNVGLPPAEKDKENWQLISNIFNKNELRDSVTEQQIKFTANVFNELLAIRSSSPLLKMATANEIIDRIHFKNTGKEQETGLIVMHIDDSQTSEILDENYQQMVIIFNANPQEKSFTFNNAHHFKLHPIQQNSVDENVKTSSSNENVFTVPALTTTVFVQPRTKLN